MFGSWSGLIAPNFSPPESSGFQRLVQSEPNKPIMSKRGYNLPIRFGSCSRRTGTDFCESCVGLTNTCQIDCTLMCFVASWCKAVVKCIFIGKCVFQRLATPLGFEPRITPPKGAVLPLHHGVSPNGGFSLPVLNQTAIDKRRVTFVR